MTIKITSKGLFHRISEFFLPKDNTLGLGTFGTVQLAIHKKTQKKYAIKTIDLKQLGTQEQLDILEREILLHSSLDHPHIIKLWDTIIQDGKVFMILDHAERGSLFHFQNRYGRFSELEGYKFFFQTLTALDYMHRKDIMHRDIKPQNLLLDHQKNIKICDFGWATQEITKKRETFCGTYEYMAPEMANQELYDYKIDVWAIGILLHELTHGAAPFKADSLDEINDQHNNRVYDLDDELSIELRYLIMRILRFQPCNRPEIRDIMRDPWIEKTTQMFFFQDFKFGEKQNKPRKTTNKNSKENIDKLGEHMKKVRSPKHRRYESMNIDQVDKYDFLEPMKNTKVMKELLGKKCKTQNEEGPLIKPVSFQNKNNKPSLGYSPRGTRRQTEEKMMLYFQKSHEKRKKHRISTGNLKEYHYAELEPFTKRKKTGQNKRK